MNPRYIRHIVAFTPLFKSREGVSRDTSSSRRHVVVSAPFFPPITARGISPIQRFRDKPVAVLALKPILFSTHVRGSVALRKFSSGCRAARIPEKGSETRCEDPPAPAAAAASASANSRAAQRRPDKNWHGFIMQPVTLRLGTSDESTPSSSSGKYSSPRPPGRVGRSTPRDPAHSHSGHLSREIACCFSSRLLPPSFSSILPTSNGHERVRLPFVAHSHATAGRSDRCVVLKKGKKDKSYPFENNVRHPRYFYGLFISIASARAPSVSHLTLYISLS